MAAKYLAIIKFLFKKYDMRKFLIEMPEKQEVHGFTRALLRFN